MGLGLSQYLPLLLYIGLAVGTLLSVFMRPMFGVLVLFPLLPYSSIMEKMQPFPFGRNIVNIMMGALFIGWLMHREPVSEEPVMRKPVIVLLLTSCIAFINGIAVKGFPLSYLVDWKDYLMLPLIWFLVSRAIVDKKMLKYFTAAVLLGVCGVAFYYVRSLSWMNLAHFSYKVRDTFSGLFLYLGPNHYGAFFVHMFFIIFGLFLFLKSFWQKALLLGLMAALGYCIMYSYSRGAYLALLGGLMVVGLIRERKILLIAALFLMFWKSLVPISVIERVEMTRSKDGQLEESAADRVMLWNHAWGMFRASPLVGRGYNTFAYAGYIDTHNYYLKMLAEQGLMGLAAFLYLLFAAMRLAWKLYRETEDPFFKGIGFGFALSVFSLMITNAFGDRWSYLSMGSYFWVFMGIMTRSYLINRQEAAAVKAVESPAEADDRYLAYPAGVPERSVR